MKINLHKEFFKEIERELLTHGDMRAVTFRYSTGVEALRVENKNGYFIILPFQGQQIWRAGFLGKELTMCSTVKEPVPTLEYLKTYGGFLYHCGVSAFGVPQADDNHPQHGETPNIEYDNAYIKCGEDEKGKYIAVGGVLDYNIAFVRHYLFTPECRLYEDATVLKIDVCIENKRHSPMEYMYLCHINFRPKDGAELVYSAKRDKDHINVHKIIGDAVPQEQAAKLKEYMDKVGENPAIQDIVGEEGQVYNPEICFTVKYDGDEQNRAYTMQYERGVGACYVSHPVDVLPLSIRWISRSEDEQSMGMVLPATAEHLGYSYAKRNGQIKVLAEGESLKFSIEAGYITDAEAKKVEEKIDKILGK